MSARTLISVLDCPAAVVVVVVVVVVVSTVVYVSCGL